jgi:hypothetical protein
MATSLTSQEEREEVAVNPGTLRLGSLLQQCLQQGSGRPVPKTVDASIPVIEFDCQGTSQIYNVSLDYTLASNEYHGLKANETAKFNDLVGIFLNGEAPADNIATVDGQIVSANTIRVGTKYYSSYSHNGRAPFVVGMTVLLTLW